MKNDDVCQPTPKQNCLKRPDNDLCESFKKIGAHIDWEYARQIDGVLDEESDVESLEHSDGHSTPALDEILKGFDDLEPDDRQGEFLESCDEEPEFEILTMKSPRFYKILREF